MSDSKKVTVSGGLGLGNLLLVLFVGLKLTGHIAWPWVWVLSPVWIGIGAVLAIWILALALVFAGAVISMLADSFKRSRK